jgi:hypothetical protein
MEEEHDGRSARLRNYQGAVGIVGQRESYLSGKRNAAGEQADRGAGCAQLREALVTDMAGKIAQIV